MNDFESYDDFIDFINPFTPYRPTDRLNIPALVTKDKKNNTYAYIVHLPENIDWNENIYHQAHVTWNQIGGGLTGQGSGTYIKYCWKKEVHDTILSLPTYIKYVTILRVGMNFENSAPKTPISYFHDDIVRWGRGKNDYWIKAHIIAHPDKEAYLHDQHLVLNREWWNKLGSPNLFKLKFTDYERADTNFHDDYTPPWLKPKEYPIIRNFPIEERRLKVFSYNRLPDDIPKKWFELEEIRNGIKFYPFNTESFYSGVARLQKVDLMKDVETIVSPTAGFVTEYLAKMFNIKHIVFYDITKEHLKYKKEIIDLVNDGEELKLWTTMRVNTPLGMVLGGLDSMVSPLDVKREYWNFHGSEQHELLYGKNGELHKNGTIDEQIENLNWVRDNCTIDYVHCNMMEDSYDNFLSHIENKIVLFNISNIYSYIRTHINYRLKHIVNRFDSLETFLQKNTDDYILRGLYPNKTNIQIVRKVKQSEKKK